MHCPRVTWQFSTRQPVNDPASEGFGDSGFDNVVAHSPAGQARSQQQAPARPQDPPHLGRVVSPSRGTQIVEATAVERKMERPGRERERQYVGLGEGHARVLALGPDERGPGQIDPDGIPALSGEVGDLGSQSAADVSRRAGLAEPSISLGRHQLGRRSAEVPPAVDAIEIGISHSANDPTPIPGPDRKVVPATCPIER